MRAQDAILTAPLHSPPQRLDDLREDVGRRIRNTILFFLEFKKVRVSLFFFFFFFFKEHKISQIFLRTFRLSYDA